MCGATPQGDVRQVRRARGGRLAADQRSVIRSSLRCRVRAGVVLSSEVSDRVDVSVRHVLLRHASQRPAGLGKQRSRTAESSNTDSHVTRADHDNHERFFTLLRMTGQRPVSKPPAVGLLNRVHHPAWGDELQRPPTGPKEYVHSGNCLRAGTGYLKSGHPVHMPAEEPVYRPLESRPPGSYRDITVYVAVAGRQGSAARGSHLPVRHPGSCQLGEGLCRIPPHRITVTTMSVSSWRGRTKGTEAMPSAPAEYRRIADELTTKIKSGELVPGTKLPSTSELGDQFGVSVATVYRAVSLLHDRDLVVGQPGRGVYVAGKE